MEENIDLFQMMFPIPVAGHSCQCDTSEDTAIHRAGDASLLIQVILDLIPYENIAVKRALAADGAVLEKLGVSSVPSCYLIYPNGSHGLINM